VIRGRRGARADESEAFRQSEQHFCRSRGRTSLREISSIVPPLSGCLKTKAICSSENRFRFMAPFRDRFSMPEKIALSMDRFAGPRSSRMRSMVRRGMRGGDRCEAEPFDDGAGSADSVSVMDSRPCASVTLARHST
jgi:hypothetical protein